MGTEETSLAAWRMTIKNRSIEKGVVFHSDRSVQYANKKFRNVIDSCKMITRSMGRKWNCWDNPALGAERRNTGCRILDRLTP